MLLQTSDFDLLFFQDALEYRRKMRLLKVRMLDGTVKSLMVDDSQVVANLMVLICTKIGITNHDEYSLVWDKPEENQENIPTNKFGTLGGTMTLRKTKYKEGEKEIDPKMEELKRQLNTEDGGKNNAKQDLNFLPNTIFNFTRFVEKPAVFTMYASFQ